MSLPFSDHCDPLVNDAASERDLLTGLQRTLAAERARYVEIRATHAIEGLTLSTPSYHFHSLDLTPDHAALFAHCHKSSTQRKILRAEREGLMYECGRSQPHLDAFWKLLLLTRRRHRIPPQPATWFRNLIDCFGDALQIRVALLEQQPVASILTLRHRDTLVYKYGCSDTRFHNVGGMHLLFWKAIQEAKRDGLTRFDLGRTDIGNTGLATFKERWGAARTELTYSIIRSVTHSPMRAAALKKQASGFAEAVIARLPDRLFVTVGRILYKHMG